MKTLKKILFLLFFTLCAAGAEAESWKDWEVCGDTHFKELLRRKADGQVVKRFFEIREILQRISEDEKAEEEIRHAISDGDPNAALIYALLAKYTMPVTRTETAMCFLRKEFEHLKALGAEYETAVSELSKVLCSYFSDMSYSLPQAAKLQRMTVDVKKPEDLKKMRDEIERANIPEVTVTYFFWKASAMRETLTESEIQKYMLAKKSMDSEVVDVFECMEGLGQNALSASHAYRLYAYASLGIGLALPTAASVADCMKDFKTATYLYYLDYKRQPHSEKVLERLHYIFTNLLVNYDDTEAARLAGFIEAMRGTESCENWNTEHFSKGKAILKIRMSDTRFEKFFEQGQKDYAEKGVYENAFFEQRFIVRKPPYALR